MMRRLKRHSLSFSKSVWKSLWKRENVPSPCIQQPFPDISSLVMFRPQVGDRLSTLSVMIDQGFRQQRSFFCAGHCFLQMTTMRFVLCISIEVVRINGERGGEFHLWIVSAHGKSLSDHGVTVDLVFRISGRIGARVPVSGRKIAGV